MKNFGLITFFIGAGVLGGVVIYEVIRDIITSGETPAIVGIGIGIVILGVIITLIALIGERIRDSKKEQL